MARPGGGGRPHTSAWLPPPNIEPGGIELGHVDRDRDSHYLSRAQAVRAQVARLRWGQWQCQSQRGWGPGAGLGRAHRCSTVGTGVGACG